MIYVFMHSLINKELVKQAIKLAFRTIFQYFGFVAEKKIALLSFVYKITKIISIKNVMWYNKQQKYN